jgi:hypothetical protein
MKKHLLLILTIALSLTVSAQDLQKAKATSAIRLFGDKDDLASVLTIIPAGSYVDIVNPDTTSGYILVLYNDQQGFAQAGKLNFNLTKDEINKATIPVQTSVENRPAPASRYDRLMMKYGSPIGKLLYQNKIWKGISSDMVLDSWGKPLKINLTYNDNTREEEWIYSKKWLLFRDNVLVNWGPVKY